MDTSSARPDDLDDFVRDSRAADDELRTRSTQLRSAYGEFQDGNRWGHLDATSLLTAFGTYIDLNEGDAKWVAQIAAAFRAAGGDGDLARLPDAAIAASLRAAGLGGGRASVTFDDPIAYGFPPTSGFADDPVNTASGNFVHKAVDREGFDRVYNSRSSAVGAFGTGWSSWADTRLRISADGAAFHGPDGQVAFFGRQGAGYGRVVGIAATLDGDLSLRWFDGRVWRFDDTGRLLTANDLSFVYTDGRLSSVGDVTVGWTGERITTVGDVAFTYDESGDLVGDGTHRYEVDDGRVTAVIDADDVVHARNTYDPDGRVLTQTSRFGHLTRYVYLPGHVTVVGETDVYVHDDRGRLLSVTDAHGQTLRRAYDEWGHPVTVTDRNGAVVTMSWDDRGHLLRRDGFEYRYDDAGRVVEVRFGDAAVRYRYDGANRTPSDIVDGEGGVTRLEVRGDLVHRIVDPDGVTVDFGFDDAGRLVATTDADGNTARLERDGLGRVVAAITPLGRRTTFEYGPGGHLVAQTDPDGARWQCEYSRAGRATARIDPLGARHEFHHGPHGEVEASRDPLGRITTRQYDSLGNLARLILPDGAKWDFAHDALSRLISTTDPAGATWLREYDTIGTLTATIDPAGTRYSAAVDARGRITGLDDGITSAAFAFDPLGRTIAQIRPDGSAARAGYDRCGRRVTVEGPAGGVIRVEYTPAGRLARTVTPGGAVTVYEHDQCGRLAAVTDPLGRRWTYHYDHDGRPVARINPDGGRETLEYDPVGRPVRRLRPGTGAETVEYNLAGRPVAASSLATGPRRFRYDLAGQMVAASDGLGNTTHYRYDLGGRLSSVTDPLGATTEFRYDAAGRPVARTDPLGRTGTVDYDPAGRMVTWTDPAGRRQQWRRDRSGRVRSIEADGAAPITVIRDALGRPVQADEGTRRVTLHWDRSGRLTRRERDGLRLSWSYDADGNRTGLTYPDGSRTGYEFDASGQLTAVRHGDGAPRLLNRDANGDLVAAGGDQVDRDESGRVVARAGRRYGYDATGRLRFAGETAFEYDANGRLVREHDTGRDIAYRYDAAGQLLARGDTTFEYDAAGRRTAAIGPDGRVDYRWDAFGRLAGVGGTGVEVDPLGELAAVGGVPVLWDSAHPVGGPCWIGDEPVRASPRDAHRDDRDVWGAPGSVSLAVGYRGELEFGGLVWLRNRVYSPAERSFLSPDPLPGLPGTGSANNPYHYAGNDPINLADPLGLRPVTDAELRAYRDEMGSGFFEDAGEWVGDNWEYIAAGAMIVGGIAVMATGVGGPIGAAMIGGALLSAGSSAGIQKFTTGEVDWGQVAVQGLIGGAAGGLGAGAGMLAGGARFLGTNPFVRGAVVGGIENVAGGAITRGLSGADPFDPGGLATDLLIGGVAGGVGGRLGAGRAGPPRPGVGVDANPLIRALDHGELAGLDKAIGDRVPVVSPQAASEYLARGVQQRFDDFLNQRGGRIGATPTEAEAAALRERATQMVDQFGNSRRLGEADSRVVASAMRDQLPLITDDRRLTRFLENLPYPVEPFP
ncbi:DUF6531 domain-containing protein [Actinoplanes palleronii]|uniref:RHS repeat-associated protein n=1 Tax=Actinoplanes palleronii TaxID=113570 RepID=A0ABQ4BDX3_9ACTN|nr:DUF6531 domain-containing protein [Actinoplanes palleronii]GIE68802.1 hypothetical protein Apa02nite_049100 [Actinoplanes palleronii]